MFAGKEVVNKSAFANLPSTVYQHYRAMLDAI
jgi:hypothetical protein